MKNVYQHFSRLLLILVALVWSSQAFAQGRTVTGKVTSDEDSQGLPGVNILIKGTSTGAVTDFDGNYTITASDSDVLVFSFIGFVAQEVTVGSQSVIDVVLSSDVTTLSEIVVTGYGTQEKKEVTSSISSVKEEDFNQGTVNNPAQLIQGKVPGLTITKAGGNPNDGYTVRLRGVTTFGGNQEPLVVIDGLIGADLSSVDPADIASIDVLKDGSAAAIYGTRGSSGVILVTTKSGKKGKTDVDYNGSVAFETVDRTMSFMDASTYLQQPGAVDLGSDTDWLDQVTQTGVSHIHNLAMSGGMAGTSYRASINYRDVTGIGVNTGFQQLNARLNLSQKALNEKATFTVNLANTNVDRQFGTNDAFKYAVLSNPTLPVLFDGTAGLSNVGGYAERDIFDYLNPVSIQEQFINDGKNSLTSAQLRAEYDFTGVIEGLRIAAQYATQRSRFSNGTYIPQTAKYQDAFVNGGAASRRVDMSENDLFEVTLDWIGSAGSTDITVLAGYSYQDFFNEGFGMSGGKFLTDATTYNNMGASQEFNEGLGNVFSYANESKLIAFFGRVNLNVNNTYFISVSARQEGSTRFGEDNKWGLFPAASAGVDITQITDIGGLENLKFRLSYGRTGAIPGGSYQSLQRFGPSANSFFFNGEYVPSYGPVSNANPALGWETKDEINIGLDFVTSNEKFTGSLEYYTRTVSDLLLTVDVPVPPNLFGQTLVNIGELGTNGFEAMVEWAAVDNGNVTFNTGLNFATFKTTINSLTSGDLSFGEGGVLYQANMGSPGQNQTQLVRVKEGEPLGDLWGPVWDGTTVDGAGVPIFNDIDGDGVVTDSDADRTVIGNGLPDFTIGWNSSFTFGGGWDLNIFFRGAFGHDLLNSYRGFYENLESTTVNNWNIVNTDQFNPDVQKAVVNSIHVEDASFIKLDNMSLGYNFDMSNSDAFDNIRLYVSGQNLFTITGYSGIDPEVRYTDNGNALAPGIERRETYFTARLITFGVNLGF